MVLSIPVRPRYNTEIIYKEIEFDMNGCIAKRKDVYYVRLTYYDKHHERKEKWVSTGLSGRGAKQKATAMIDSMIEKYSYLEKSEHRGHHRCQEQR